MDYYKHLFLRDTLIHNEDGTFVCRKGTMDLWLLRDDYEKELKPYFNNINGIFIDVGAHAGKYAIRVARKFADETGKVIAVEPEKLNFNALKENARRNSVENKIIFVNKACSSKRGDAKLYLDPFLGGSASLLKNEKRNKFEDVSLDTLDRVVRESKVELKNIELIKIDVDGGELEVLKGCKQILRSAKPKIVFEALDSSAFEKCCAFLKGFDYEVKKITKENCFACPR